MVEWKWFFAATVAICSTVVPKVFMWKLRHARHKCP